MRKYSGPDGVRLWIDRSELEDLMISESTKASLMPDLAYPVVNVEEFVERHLQAQFDSYAELAPAVLGETEFRVGDSPKVSINRDLTAAALDDDESPDGLKGPWRATVAHEATHVLLTAAYSNSAKTRLRYSLSRQRRPQMLAVCSAV